MASVTKDTDSARQEERILAKLKQLYDEELLKDLNNRKTSRKLNAQKALQDAKELAHKVIVDELSLEWLKLVDGGSPQQYKARYLLIDQVLPAVIIGLMKLLTEIDRRSLVTNYSEPNFNPINFLAQFLMRNNPRHEIFPEQNPYISGMRKVAAQLSAKVPTSEQIRLTEMRSAIERRKIELSMAKLQRASEFDQRVAVLTGQFPDWGVSTFDGVVEGALIESAIHSFVERYEESLTEIYQARAENFFTAVSEKIRQCGLNAVDYSNLLAKRSGEMTPEVFGLFVSHLSSCGAIYRRAVENRRTVDTLVELFNKIDMHREGRINREKVIEALRNLYSSAANEKQNFLVAPSQWPILPPEEDLTAEEVISLEVELPCSDLFEAEPPPEEQKPEEREEPEGEEVTVEEKAPEAAEATEETPSAALDDTTGYQPEPPADAVVQNAGVEAEGAPSATEPVVDYSVHDEMQLVTAAFTIEPSSGDIAKTAVPVEESSLSAPPRRPETLPFAEAASLSAPPTRPPARIGTVLEDDAENEEEQDVLPDLPQHATINRFLSVAAKRLEAYDGTTLSQQQFLQTVQNFVIPAIIGAEDAEDAKKMPPKEPVEGEAEDEYVIDTIDKTDLQIEAEMVLKKLSKSLLAGYLETDTEVSQRLKAAKLAANVKSKHDRLDKLFDRWDNEGQGVIDLDEIENLLARYKHGQENASIRNTINNFMESDSLHSDRRLTRSEFRKLIVNITDSLPGPDESFEYLVTFMNNSIKLSLAEQLRGSCRRRWLGEIQSAILTAGLSLENVFRTAFQAIYKDAELHGERKQISIYVALGERVPENERLQHGDGLCLRYVAATPKDAPYVLNQRLYRDMPGVSLSVLGSGRPIHVPRIAAHGNIHFWNADRPKSDRDGSFLVLPLKDTSQKQTFGILAIDTIGELQSTPGSGGFAGGSFTSHEIKFYQGVAASLADAFHVVQHTVDITEQLNKAVPLIFQQIPTVLQCTIYLTELDPRTCWTSPQQQQQKEGLGGPPEDVVLRKVIEADRMRQKTEQIGNLPARLVRDQNLFREYVFDAAATGSSVIKKSYGERRIAVSLRRPSDGRTIAVFDLGIRDPGKERLILRADGTSEKRSLPLLTNEERLRLVRLLRVVQATVGELSMEFLTQTEGEAMINPKIMRQPGDREKFTLLAESIKVAAIVGAKIRKALMMDRQLLALHRARIAKYEDTKVFIDIRGIGRPNNDAIQKFSVLLIGLAYPKYYTSGEITSGWINTKVFMTVEMRDRLLAIDPSHPRIADFLVKHLIPNMPPEATILPLLVTSRLQLLYDFFMTCARIASTCVSLDIRGAEFSSPAVSLDTPTSRLSNNNNFAE